MVWPCRLAPVLNREAMSGCFQAKLTVRGIAVSPVPPACRGHVTIPWRNRHVSTKHFDSECFYLRARESISRPQQSADSAPQPKLIFAVIQITLIQLVFAQVLQVAESEPP